MKKVLIVIQDMGTGGAQKSLTSFLKCLERHEKKAEYEIDLIVAKAEGEFLFDIPQYINILKTPRELCWLAVPSGHNILKGYFSIRGWFGKLLWKITKNYYLSKTENIGQAQWNLWKRFIPKLSKEYDIAISYMNGYPNYYVMDKVIAKKKVLWVHNEYKKLNYNTDMDREYYENADKIITISDLCVRSFLEEFPEYAKKVFVLENITMCDEILKKGNIETDVEMNKNSIKLLSIGRLSEQKGFDYAIDAAKILNEKGINFNWYILGDGPDKAKLLEQIENNEVSRRFHLLGCKENPYSYMRECDIFVQSSRYEGKSIVLDEVKLFDKPIVVTNYPTVHDTIIDGQNGVIVEMNSSAIADGICKIIEEADYRQKLIDNIASSSKNNMIEIEKYINVML